MVAIITGASQGIGAGLAAGYRRQGCTVVGTVRTIKPSDDPRRLRELQHAVGPDVTH